MKKSDSREIYLTAFEKFRKNVNGQAQLPLRKIREAAIQRFSELGFPNTRMEEWKYTDVTPLLKHDFKLVENLPEVSNKDIEKFLFDDADSHLVVFINGRFSETLSNLNQSDGKLEIEPLEQVMARNHDLLNRYLTKYAPFEKDAFMALNTAFLRSGIFIRIPEFAVIENPIHILNIAAFDGTVYQTHPRTLVTASKGSQARIVESYQHLSGGVYFNNAVTEIVLEDDAIVDHYKIQIESIEAFRINNTFVHLGRNSVYNSLSVDLGGRLVRNNIKVRLNDIHGETNLYGFYLADGKQHIDNHTLIDHAQPHCNSNELYKGMLSDKARAVFSGTILVRQDAQKTNAFQSNKNLLLSEEAEVDSRPQLKIFADDVRCTHGATVGQLNEEALFYLQQRGIGKDQAQIMLRFAFAKEIIEKIKPEGLREAIGQIVSERLKKI